MLRCLGVLTFLRNTLRYFWGMSLGYLMLEGTSWIGFGILLRYSEASCVTLVSFVSCLHLTSHVLSYKILFPRSQLVLCARHSLDAAHIPSFVNNREPARTSILRLCYPSKIVSFSSLSIVSTKFVFSGKRDRPTPLHRVLQRQQNPFCSTLGKLPRFLRS